MSEQKIVSGLSRLSANYLRDPIGVRHPPLNGIEVIENREYMSVTIQTPFADEEDLAIAEEIVVNGMNELVGTLTVRPRVLNGSLEISGSFPTRNYARRSPGHRGGDRECMYVPLLHRSPRYLVSAFRDKLKSEVMLSKVRTSADIRTAIAHSSLVMTGHRLADKRGG